MVLVLIPALITLANGQNFSFRGRAADINAPAPSPPLRLAPGHRRKRGLPVQEGGTGACLGAECIQGALGQPPSQAAGSELPLAPAYVSP